MNQHDKLRCDGCPREATFDSPLALCDRHWAQWWVDGLDIADRRRRNREFRMVLRNTWAKYGIQPDDKTRMAKTFRGPTRLTGDTR